ncbi:flagellar hook-basal body complex protein FliE [Metabacillus crassostreae]|uniref:flagellar hook-basal body complex protein FliE n=1 Tax=Metabacillus crassostreae TaxID=929098 RepID=UPI00195C34B9|nr:flagellar hook-basal body complex protein FliE [Metabacillus crassostreae]MBM7603325.1 flagellar hook-basal body complex protein FliE [Metabacillus crassostreae]
MINRVSPFQIATQQLQQTQLQQKPAIGLDKNTATNNVSFGDFLKESINQVNQAQTNSDKMTNALASGQNVELHDVMISAQKSSVALTMAVEVRNKVIEAYQEMMRMQV